MTQHLALYRKYRPTGFDALIGQEPIKVTLMNALRLGKVSHAYLFTGPRGTGKTSSAKILAKAINCLNPAGLEPCGHCESCKDSNPDILEMDAASNNGVDDIRELREKVVYTPVYGKYKVYIIDETHMLTTQAFNALLKTLEEPPAHAVFILATTEPHKIPLTILSRCQRYDFKRISQDDIVQRMEWIVEKENADVEKEALQLIAQIAAGGMRDALSLLDQAISHATGKVTLQDVINLTGAVDTRKIGKLIEYIGRKDIEGSLEHFNSCFQSGQEPKFFIEEMMNYYRDILLYEKLGEKATLKKGLTDPAFQTVRQSVTPSLIFHHLAILQETMSKMKFHHDIHLLVEMAIVEMVNEKNEDLRAEVIQLRLEVENLKLSGGYVNNSNKLEAIITQTQTVENQSAEETVNTAEKTESGTPTIESKRTMEIQSLEQQSEPAPSAVEQKPSQPNVNENSHEEMQEQKVEPVELNKQSSNEGDILTNLTLDDLMGGVSNIPSFAPNPIKQAVEEEQNVTNNPEQEATAEEGNIAPFVQMVEEAIENKEDWVNLIDENQIPPPSEEDLNEHTSGGIPTTTQETQQAIQTAKNELSQEEQSILEILDSCNKECRSAFKERSPEIMDVLRETKRATHALLREFAIRAVGTSHIIMTHSEKAKVILMERVSNRTIFESVVEDTYQPLKLILLTNKQWENIANTIRQKIS